MATAKVSRSKPAHKRGANRNEMATKKRKQDKNFSQSKDIREDRGTRQRTSGQRK